MELIFPFQNGKDSMGSEALFDIMKNGHIIHTKLVNSLIIFGPSQSCKTSLLMQAAVTEASYGKKVLFVSPQKLSKLPSSVHGMPEPSSHTMKNINFLYSKNSTELQGYLSSLHLQSQHTRPSAIVVDDLNYYCSSQDGDSLSELVCLSKLSSLICEAASFQHYSKESHNENESEEVPRCAIMSWNTSLKGSPAKMPQLNEVAMKFCSQVWTVKEHLSSRNRETYQIDTVSSKGHFALTFALKSVNPSLKAIFVQDVLMKKEEH